MKAFSKRVLNILPGFLRDALRSRYRCLRDGVSSAFASCHDWRMYLRHSGLMGRHSRGTLEADIIKSYHRIEKGLALSTPRPGFGADAVDLLTAGTREYLSRFGPDRTSLAAVNTLAEYLAFNGRHGLAMPGLEATVAALREAHDGCVAHAEGGTREVTKSEILSRSQIDLRHFLEARHSVRQFSPVPVDMGLIEEAVRMAQKSPSVCNRQAGRVYAVADRDRQTRLLALQNGNRGFGDQADKLLVVTESLDCFLTVGERYQCWIDGGLFAMTLIYALHSLGLGTCCLNWSVLPQVDREFKALAGIPGSQAIIMLVAVGHLPENLRIAQSPRRPLDEVFHVL